MADDARDRSDEEHPQAPWWWGMGPVGAALLVVAGIAWALWAFLGSSGTEDTSTDGYQASRIIAIGLVIGGTAALERFRARTSRTRRAEEGPEEQAALRDEERGDG